ncbi:uncharacterized protein LOC113211008 [Frankliniella occidentalis]|uniref:Uncharacterized protein LOC113211008 n=1 Tax=Frankliniella occidentalis TaxID=133901 RepID=A0A6J1SVX1_FRAOC|nr:uncharacterized protein LOC113211008 [Frankliniella occidentalis]
MWLVLAEKFPLSKVRDAAADGPPTAEPPPTDGPPAAERPAAARPPAAERAAAARPPAAVGLATAPPTLMHRWKEENDQEDDQVYI